MTQKPRKAGSRAAQGAPTDDPRIIQDPTTSELPVFKWTQLGPPYIKRSDITRADYNPRIMDLSGKKKLREGLKRYGLVERPVFNAQTGVLVGGHQRLEQMDKLMEYGKTCEDYLLPINAISISEQKEKELNVILNNPSVQGNYDTGALERLFSADVNPFAAGFDQMELSLMFGGDVASDLKARFGMSDDEGIEDVEHEGLGASELLQKEADKIEALKARKREQVAEDRDRNDSNHILHIVFPNRKALSAYLKSLGMDEDQHYVDSARFLENVSDVSDNAAWGEE